MTEKYTDRQCRIEPVYEQQQSRRRKKQLIRVERGESNGRCFKFPSIDFYWKTDIFIRLKIIIFLIDSANNGQICLSAPGSLIEHVELNNVLACGSLLPNPNPTPFAEDFPRLTPLQVHDFFAGNYIHARGSIHV